MNEEVKFILDSLKEQMEKSIKKKVLINLTDFF